jgi:tyrosinase
MRTEVTINGIVTSNASYISWAPIPSQVRLADSGGAANPIAVKLRNKGSIQGGRVVFFDPLSNTWKDELQVNLPADGSPVDFLLAGNFEYPSSSDGDAVLEVIDIGNEVALSETLLMVRIRKNANNLTTGERDRFISALAKLNDRGMGRFSDFRNMHVSAALGESHDNAGFLPWHRAYLLDLERELQVIDPSVALPYWRFDQPAPNLFTEEFMGETGPADVVQFSSENPLNFWATDTFPGIVRQPRFTPATEPAGNSLGRVISEAATLLLGGGGNTFGLFRLMEGQPHARAHGCFGGFITKTDTAPRDPLFFLLHANVDRLWAKWQWIYRRFESANVATYEFLGSHTDPNATRVGHNLKDTMWPWDQDMNPPRPVVAPGGKFPASLTASAPGDAPTVLSMIDYQGVLNPLSRLGFDYDDVPFEY